MEELYFNRTAEIGVIVEPLDINATSIHLKYYRDKTIMILKTRRELVRNITADCTAILRNETTIIILDAGNSTVQLDYSTIDLGNYTLIIRPITYITAYRRHVYCFNITTVEPPNIWMYINVDQLI